MQCHNPRDGYYLLEGSEQIINCGHPGQHYDQYSGYDEFSYQDPSDPYDSSVFAQEQQRQDQYYQNQQPQSGQSGGYGTGYEYQSPPQSTPGRTYNPDGSITYGSLY